jgi:copper chaperone CopZ
MTRMSPALGLALVLAATAAQAQDHHALQLEIEGLFCEICARTLEYRLGGVDGVAEVTVDFASGRAVLVLDDGAVVDEAGLTALIESYGFRLLAIEALEPSD